MPIAFCQSVLAHTEQLLDVLDEQHQLKRSKNRLEAWRSGIRPPPGFPEKKPWVPEYAEECQYKCCHRCRPALEGRAYLSLDGILNDDVPPTAATGFGFHTAGARPVMDADIVKKIGLRAVPWVCLPVSHWLTVGSKNANSESSHGRSLSKTRLR